MCTGIALLTAGLLAIASADPPADSGSDTGDASEEPQGGAAVTPIELIPRVELRASYLRLTGGATLHQTTLETDIQFLGRTLLRYEVPMVVATKGGAQQSGVGDIRLQLITMLAARRTGVLALIGGVVLDTATQPVLGAGKQQVFFGAGAAAKPRPWWLPYAVIQEQLAVGGDGARPDVNQLALRLGTVVFGRHFNWCKVDLDGTFDFPDSEARLFGTLEVGSLLIGRVGLFVRSGTQLAGARQLDYSVHTGVRYLFRLGKSQ
jgi:hypothetical protein